MTMRTRYIIHVGDGRTSYYPNKSLQTRIHARARRIMRKRQREGFVARLTTVRSR